MDSRHPRGLCRTSPCGLHDGRDGERYWPALHGSGVHNNSGDSALASFTHAIVFGVMRILIVEDDVNGSETLQELLELGGHQVVAAANGLDGWEKFQGGHFSVLISDWVMPEIGGIELCRRVRAAGMQDYCYIILL